jgi:tetratricopeptide (TPR) repeat protein
LDLRERRYQQAEDGFRALVQANDSRGALGLIQCEIAQGQWQQAIQIASEQLRHSPDRQDYRMALAHVYRSGNFPAAAGNSRLMIGKDPKSARLYLQLGERKSMAATPRGRPGRFSNRPSTCSRRCRAGPRSGSAVRSDRTFEGSPQEYQIVIQLQPENAAALNNLAYLDAEEGVDLDQALARAQRAQQRCRTIPTFRTRWPWFTSGRT